MFDHLAEHVEKEMENPESCNWINNNGGGVACNKKIHDFEVHHLMPHIQSKKQKDFWHYHRLYHLIVETGELLIENIKFFKRAGYKYQCIICKTFFSKTLPDARLD